MRGRHTIRHRGHYNSTARRREDSEPHSRLRTCHDDHASDWSFQFLHEHAVDIRNRYAYPVLVFRHPKISYATPAADFACKPGPSPKEQPQRDIKIRNEGSLVLLEPMTDAGTSWIDEHIDDPSFYCNTLVVESRYAREIIEEMHRAGLVVA